MYKGDAGINAINQMMQEILNPKIGNSVREVESFDKVFRVGDKVLQLVNLPEENVYNGILVKSQRFSLQKKMMTKWIRFLFYLIKRKSNIIELIGNN